MPSTIFTKSSLTLTGVVLFCLGLQAVAAPPKGITQQQQPLATDRQQLQRTRIQKPQVSLEEQVVQLRRMVEQLQQQVRRLEQFEDEEAHDAFEQFDDRLDSLESVVQITPGLVKIKSNGGLEIRSAHKLDLIGPAGLDMTSQTNLNISASGRVQLIGADALVSAPTLTASGIFRSSSAYHDLLTSKVYTPGVGNVW